MERDKEIIQFEFWNECRENRCGFCSLAYTANDDNTCDPERLRSGSEKRAIIEKILEHLPTINWNQFDEISFQGGEIMNGYDPEYLPAYNELIDRLLEHIQAGRLRKLYLITSLKYKYEGSLLQFTLEKFAKAGRMDNLMVGTSYDIKYRFTKENEREWWINLGKVKRMGCKIHCTTILSEFFINAYLNNDKRIVRMLKVFPGRLLDLIGTIGDRHSLMLPHDFLPKRSSFMKFCFFIMQNNFPLWNRFADQSGRRATNVYRPLYDTTIWRDVKHHTSNDKELLAPCGHFVYCRSYSDSDECYACDILKMLDTEAGARQ